MIARSEAQLDKMDIWAKLAAPLPAGVIEWRQDGRPIQRDDKFFARFVCYISANTVRERLDSVVPGEWDLTLELLPPLSVTPDGEDAVQVSFKARLQILGVIREDVGFGKDYKAAATDAFKRAGVRFGIAHELYEYEQNWVHVDGDGRYAKPLEDPGAAYARRHGAPPSKPALTLATAAEALDAAPVKASPRADEPGGQLDANTPAAALAAVDAAVPACPKCGGRMWDNRATKRNPKAPDFKCRDRGCDGVVWPPRDAKAPAKAKDHTRNAGPLVEPPPHDDGDFPEALRTDTDDLPF